MFGNERGNAERDYLSVDCAAGAEALLGKGDAVRRQRAHEGSVGVASDGANVDEALVLAEGQLEGLLRGIIFGNHGLVDGCVHAGLVTAGALVEDDGAAGVDGEHRETDGVAASENLHGPFFLEGFLPVKMNLPFSWVR